MSLTVNIYAAKTNLSDLVERAANGEEIVIAKAGVPMARLVPLAGGEAARVPGGWEGTAFVGDDFDDPLPDDVLQAFHGGSADEPGAGTQSEPGAGVSG